MYRYRQADRHLEPTTTSTPPPTTVCHFYSSLCWLLGVYACLWAVYSTDCPCVFWLVCLSLSHTVHTQALFTLHSPVPPLVHTFCYCYHTSAPPSVLITGCACCRLGECGLASLPRVTGLCMCCMCCVAM
jgi:hypothetical protein